MSSFKSTWLEELYNWWWYAKYSLRCYYYTVRRPGEAVARQQLRKIKKCLLSTTTKEQHEAARRMLQNWKLRWKPHWPQGHYLQDHYTEVQVSAIRHFLTIQQAEHVSLRK